jgi:O-antigen/teichoic acid export membrane protein
LAFLLANPINQAVHYARFLRLRPFDTSDAQGRSDERHRRLALSALAAAVAKGISVVTLLVSVPLTLRYLGSERYGMWATMSSFIALLTFADFGIGNGLLTSVSAASGRDDTGAIRSYISSALFVLIGVAAILLAAFAIAYPTVSWASIFNVQGALSRQEAGPAIAALAACIAIGLPLGVTQKVQMALQEGFRASLWNCLSSAMTLATLLAAIHARAGLHVLVLALVGTPLLVSLLNGLIYFTIFRPDLAPGPGAMSLQKVSYLARTGLIFVTLQTIVAAAYGSDNIIVARTLGAAQVPQYAIPAQMFTLITTVLIMGLGPLWPAYSEAKSRLDHDWIGITVRRSIAFSMMFAAAASLLLVLTAPFIIDLWVGRSIHPSVLLLLGLGCWRILDAGGNAVSVYLNGAHHLRFQLAVLSVAGGVGIILKIVLIQRIGVSGAAWGSVISYLLATVPVAIFLRRRFAS